MPPLGYAVECVALVTELTDGVKGRDSMPSLKRSSLVVVLMLPVLWASAAWAQEDEKCAASPRWIAVTVVKAHLQTPTQHIELGAGVQLLDRCYGHQVQVGEILATNRNPLYVAAQSEGARSFFSQTSGTGDNTVLQTFFVKETVQQICAAMDDCGDATRAREESGQRE